MANFIKNYRQLFFDRMWRSVFLVWSLRQFAFGLMAVYSPIYFFSNGRGLGFVFLILATQTLFNAFTRLPYALYLAKQKNIKKLFASSLLILGLVYLAFVYFINQPQIIILLAAIEGILLAIVNTSYVYLFSASQKKKNIGSQVGLQYDATYISAIIAILLGGFIASTFSLAVNFVVASIALLAASILVVNIKISWPKKAKNIKYKKSNLKNNWPFYVSGISNLVDYSVTAVIWPLTLVVVNYFTYKNIGFIIAAGLFCCLIINLVVGKIADDIDRARFLLDGTILATLLVYLLRIISIISLPGAVALTIFGYIFRGIFDVSYSALFYRKIKKSKNKLFLIAEYEQFSSYGLALFFGLLALIHQLGASDTITLISAPLLASFIIIFARLVSADNLEEA